MFVCDIAMKKPRTVNDINCLFNQLYDATAQLWHESKTLGNTKKRMVINTWLLRLEEVKRVIDLEVSRIHGIPDDEL